MLYLLLVGLLGSAAVAFSSKASAAGPASGESWPKYVRRLVYSHDLDGLTREGVFTLVALELGIEDWNSKAPWYFATTKSLINRKPGTGRGYWTGRSLTLPKGDQVRIYTSPEQSLDDLVQLLHDPIYGNAFAYGQAGDLPSFFEALRPYDADYPTKLAARYKLLRSRGLL